MRSKVATSSSSSPATGATPALATRMSISPRAAPASPTIRRTSPSSLTSPPTTQVRRPAADHLDGDGLRLGAALPVSYRDVRAGPREGDGQRAADAPTSPGDERDPTLEHHHGIWSAGRPWSRHGPCGCPVGRCQPLDKPGMIASLATRVVATTRRAATRPRSSSSPPWPVAAAQPLRRRLRLGIPALEPAPRLDPRLLGIVVARARSRWSRRCSRFGWPSSRTRPTS